MSETGRINWIRVYLLGHWAGVGLLTVGAVLFTALIAVHLLGVVDEVPTLGLIAVGLILLGLGVLALWGLLDGILLYRRGYRRTSAYSFLYTIALVSGILSNLIPVRVVMLGLGGVMIGLIVTTSVLSDRGRISLPSVIHWAGSSFTYLALIEQIPFEVWVAGIIMWTGGLVVNVTRLILRYFDEE